MDFELEDIYLLYMDTIKPLNITITPEAALTCAGIPWTISAIKGNKTLILYTLPPDIPAATPYEILKLRGYHSAHARLGSNLIGGLYALGQLDGEVRISNCVPQDIVNTWRDLMWVNVVSGFNSDDLQSCSSRLSDADKIQSLETPSKDKTLQMLSHGLEALNFGADTFDVKKIFL